MEQIIWIALGGAIGAVARYLVGSGIGALMHTLIGVSPFPWGTLSVNVIGCFLMGCTVALFAHKTGELWGLTHPHHIHTMRAFIAVGILGGFTTFSAFSLDVMRLFEQQNYTLAALYLTTSVILSIGALVLGLSAAGKLLTS